MNSRHNNLLNIGIFRRREYTSVAILMQVCGASLEGSALQSLQAWGDPPALPRQQASSAAVHYVNWAIVQQLRKTGTPLNIYMR